MISRSKPNRNDTYGHRSSSSQSYSDKPIPNIPAICKVETFEPTEPLDSCDEEVYQAQDNLQDEYEEELEEIKGDPEHEPEPEPEPKSESKPEPEPAPKPEPQPEPQLAPQLESVEACEDIKVHEAGMGLVGEETESSDIMDSVSSVNAIDLIPGADLPNLPLCRMNPIEYLELPKLVGEPIRKEFIR